MLLLAFFVFLLCACGIPSYLNLDDNITWVEEPEHTKGTIIAKTLKVDATGVGRIASMVTNGGPGVKLFYHINDSESNYRVVVPSGTLDITSDFNTYLRGASSLNGRIWYPQSSSAAPGFYIYTSLKEQKKLFSLARPQSNDVDASSLAVLVGTFAFETATGMEFCHSNEMDLKLPSDGQLKLEITIDDNYIVNLNTDKHLYTYHKEPFTIDTLGLAEDSHYWKPLTETTKLYLHVFASLYGGKGTFSNTYWSKLEYLGYLEL